LSAVYRSDENILLELQEIPITTALLTVGLQRFAQTITIEKLQMIGHWVIIDISILLQNYKTSTPN
jgi:hypothetical protein